MDIKQLKRDRDFVVSHLKENGKQLFTTKEAKVYFPARFAERDLADIGHEIFVMGYVAVVIEGRYCSLNVPAMIPMAPEYYSTLEIDGVEYYEFIFPAGSALIENLDLVIRDTNIYYVMAEIYSKGNVPWYIGYHEASKMFDLATKHAGTKVVSNRKTIELWVSILARNPDKLTQYYAETVQSEEDVVKRPPVLVGMRDVSLNASGTMNRVIGSYMSDGIVSSLLNPSEEVGLLEQILRQ